jgi:hypothetical protein
MSTTSVGTLKTSKGGGSHTQSTSAATPIYKKYDKVTKYSRDPNIKLKPSDLSQASVNISGEDYPMIIEFVNILDNTSQIHSTVDIEQPLFEPAPNIIIFEDYAPFAIHEKKLYFRNKDSVRNSCYTVFFLFFTSCFDDFLISPGCTTHQNNELRIPIL